MLGKIVDVCKTCQGGGGWNGNSFLYFIVFAYIFEECVEVYDSYLSYKIAENLCNNRNNYYYACTFEFLYKLAWRVTSYCSNHSLRGCK